MANDGKPSPLIKRLSLCRDEQRDLARTHHARYWAHVLIGFTAILTPVTIALTSGLSALFVSAIMVITSGIVTLALAIPFFVGRDKRRKAANMLETAVETLRNDENAKMSEKIMSLCDKHTKSIKMRKHRHEPCDGVPFTETKKIDVMRDKGERSRLARLAASLAISVVSVTGTSIWWLTAVELDPAIAPVALPILYSAGAALGIGIALVITFRKIKLEHAQAVYLTCKGCWYEAHLSGCKQGLTSLPQQPVNTYTNLAYLISGVFIGAFFATPSSFAFMIAMTFLAIGSALYHGLSNRWSGHFDVTAIYWVFSALLLHTIGQLLNWDDTPITILMVFGGGIAAAFLRLVMAEQMILKVAILLVPVYVIQAFDVWASGVIAKLLVFASLLSFLIAFLIWNRDKKRKFFLRRAGHGIWHALTALSIGLLHYVSAAF